MNVNVINCGPCNLNYASAVPRTSLRTLILTDLLTFSGLHCAKLYVYYIIIMLGQKLSDNCRNWMTVEAAPVFIGSVLVMVAACSHAWPGHGLGRWKRHGLPLYVPRLSFNLIPIPFPNEKSWDEWWYMSKCQPSSRSSLVKKSLLIDLLWYKIYYFLRSMLNILKIRASLHVRKNNCWMLIFDKCACFLFLLNYLMGRPFALSKHSCNLLFVLFIGKYYNNIIIIIGKDL